MDAIEKAIEAMEIANQYINGPTLGEAGAKERLHDAIRTLREYQTKNRGE